MLPRRRQPLAARANALRERAQKKKPELSEYVAARDWSGAMGLLQFEQQAGNLPDTSWLVYSAFHLGEFERAKALLEESLSQAGDDAGHLWLDYAICLFNLGMNEETVEAAQKAPACALQTRLLFHLAHRMSDETKLMIYHQKLQDTTEDQLSLASMHHLRGHYQEATDIYKRLLLDNRDYLALNVYVAMCYYKLDYYDVSLEILQTYLAQYPDSQSAVNLKACNSFRLYNGKAAESELKTLADKQGVPLNQFDSELVAHNLVVFRNGENALQVLPPLLNSIPEARMNLVIYHLRNQAHEEAHALIKDLEPISPEEYLLKGTVFSCIGQKTDSKEMLKIAQQYFQLVGASASHCDTIPGRQTMAMCFLLMRQFDDALIYLKSIEQYMQQDEEFQYNIGIAKAAVGQYKEAEEHLTMFEPMTSDFCYISWLARCYIMNGKPHQAWELYLKMEASDDAFTLVQLIANDGYRMGHFFYAFKAFDVLERLDPSPLYWDGKKGAAMGVFQQVIAGREQRDALREVMSMMRYSNNPQAEYFCRVMIKWARQNGMKLG